ncbi:TlpA family protein disulfide reductase [Paenibacillus sp. sgz500958]|uniref:TlpA family protein disulfide reductase n=1 Tax=Paenibacillus sp. sgz500958 TaxID=3242475 RepID=UPI0036D3FA07
MKAVNKRNLAVIAVTVFLIVLVLWREHDKASDSLPVLGQVSSAAETSPQAGTLAPAFKLQGETESYSIGGPRDKAVLLNFWASWCDPCKLEAPELNALAAKYKDVLDVYGVNVTSQDYKPYAERFIKKYSLNFPVMFDLKGDVYAKYNGAAFPTNVLIGKDGVISEVVIGLMTQDELEEKIIRLTKP